MNLILPSFLKEFVIIRDSPLGASEELQGTVVLLSFTKLFTALCMSERVSNAFVKNGRTVGDHHRRGRNVV